MLNEWFSGYGIHCPLRRLHFVLCLRRRDIHSSFSQETVVIVNANRTNRNRKKFLFWANMICVFIYNDDKDNFLQQKKYLNNRIRLWIILELYIHISIRPQLYLFLVHLINQISNLKLLGFKTRVFDIKIKYNCEFDVCVFWGLEIINFKKVVEENNQGIFSRFKSNWLCAWLKFIQSV